MAFPIPDHLPRQLDVSSTVLSKFDSATLQSLNSSFASSLMIWSRQNFMTEYVQTLLTSKGSCFRRSLSKNNWIHFLDMSKPKALCFRTLSLV
ncbi:hypothetical protein DEU56DRAFT_152409 [Suillus clintonianus]|uniref:uncharacterized protein n=1 Tax=Suillus clintonianus TaxID=1904413 RepID=UPI001B8645A6|nr:uncharacterized protein DEU56DRAFT_152409 [Suillus clintonianus]KAG2146721.1 hypothetical protein DEU56DRAFT_152409 [Suillus clintonianus]